jgi:hypothetical protein
MERERKRQRQRQRERDKKREREGVERSLASCPKLSGDPKKHTVWVEAPRAHGTVSGQMYQ